MAKSPAVQALSEVRFFGPVFSLYLITKHENWGVEKGLNGGAVFILKSGRQKRVKAFYIVRGSNPSGHLCDCEVCYS